MREGICPLRHAGPCLAPPAVFQRARYGILPPIARSKAVADPFAPRFDRSISAFCACWQRAGRVPIAGAGFGASKNRGRRVFSACAHFVPPLYDAPRNGGDAFQTSRWGHSSVGRALEWHSRGQGFDSPWLHQKILQIIQTDTRISAHLACPRSGCVRGCGLSWHVRKRNMTGRQECGFFRLRPSVPPHIDAPRNGGDAFQTSGGAIAQLVERLNGIQEVRGSTPLGSTKFISTLI